MVWSKYTYMFDDNGKYYIYNSLSNGFAELDKATYDEILRMKRDNDILSINDELLVQLKKLKVIVDNDKDEINAVKYLTLRRRNDDSRLILTINPTLSCNFACPYSRILNEYEGTDISTCLFMKNHLKDFLLAHANYKNLKCNSK